MTGINKMPAAMLAAAGLVAASVLLTVVPANAASATGGETCASPKTVWVRTNSSKPGSGSFLNNSTGTSKSYAFAAGDVTSFSGWRSVSWTATNGDSGYWYSPLPYDGCSV